MNYHCKNGSAILFEYKTLHDSCSPTLTIQDNVLQEIYTDIGVDKKRHVPRQVLNGNKSLVVSFGSFHTPVHYADFFQTFSTTCTSGIHSTKNHNKRYAGHPFLKTRFLAQNFDTKKDSFNTSEHADESGIVDFWFQVEYVVKVFQRIDSTTKFRLHLRFVSKRESFFLFIANVVLLSVENTRCYFKSRPPQMVSRGEFTIITCFGEIFTKPIYGAYESIQFRPGIKF